MYYWTAETMMQVTYSAVLVSVTYGRNRQLLQPEYKWLWYIPELVFQIWVGNAAVSSLATYRAIVDIQWKRS